VFPQAEESFSEVLRLDPDFPGAHLELGKVYISLRRNDDAMRELELALEANPGDGDASYFLGSLLVQESREAEAIPYLERATKLKPDFWAPYYYLGKAKLRLGATGGGRRTAAEGRGTEPRRSVRLLPSWAGAERLADEKRKPASALRRVQELRAAALEAATPDDAKQRVPAEE
jgi:tetratricopeptide (TPR) repeat protein